MNDQRRLIEMLTRTPMTAQEIQAALGLQDRSAVNRRIQRLRARKILRIVTYRRRPDGHKGEMAPLYGRANGLPDAVKPEARSKLEREARWRANRKRKATRLFAQDLGVWAVAAGMVAR